MSKPDSTVRTSFRRSRRVFPGAKYTLDKTVRILAEARSAFGSTLSRFQSIRHQVADMQTRLEAADSSTTAFHAWLRGENVTKEICMIKFFSYQAAQAIVENCLQLHGGLGYMDDHWGSLFIEMLAPSPSPPAPQRS